MVVRLRECCAVLRPRRVVAVVGAGHVAGMVGVWDNTFTTDELEELRQSKVCADALYSKFSELFF
jgi:pheromone shutdown protein TraB